MVAIAHTPVESSSNLSSMPKPLPRLRIGLFADQRGQPRAIVEAFVGIARSEFAEIVSIAAGNRPEPKHPWLWRLYRRLDRWAFATQGDAAETIDLVVHLESTRILELPEGLGGHPVPNLWRAEVVSLNLDVAFLLGDIDERLIEGVARYGVWRFGFGVGQEALAGLEGFREVADGMAVSISSLRARLASDNEKVLYESRSRTALFSLAKNRDKVLRRAAQLPGRVLKELHRSGGASLAADNPPGPPIPYCDQRSQAELKAVRNLARVAERIGHRALQKLFYVDQWFIAYRFSATDSEMPTLGPFSCLMPPTDRFWADPFPFERDGRLFIFFEELIFAEGKAHIAVVEISRDGSCSLAQRVLERPYHLSYPFLIESDGALFMVPETGENGSVELYRCLDFPVQWILEKVLLRAPCCADATFHRADDKWWMFVNIGVNDSDVHDELHIYHADQLYGEWHSHRLNPVKSDVQSARSAGRLYRRKGNLYRPAQIGAPLYGSGISINQVLKLTSEEFVEQEVGRILPPHGSDFLGVHTLNGVGNLSVVDGFIRRRRFGPERRDIFEPEYVWAEGYSGNEADADASMAEIFPEGENLKPKPAFVRRLLYFLSIGFVWVAFQAMSD